MVAAPPKARQRRSTFAPQLRQLGDVGGDAPGFVAGEERRAAIAVFSGLISNRSKTEARTSMVRQQICKWAVLTRI
jgi:hypothetical protein